MIRQYELVERVKSYEPAADEALLNRAYVFSMKAHGAQTRASGDPYFAHPIEVAGILTELKLDSTSIATALLHDTVEDTGTTVEQIGTLFGEETARLVDGVTKLSRLELQSDQAHQAENLRKFLLALSEDIRVLLVKLADRLHNMRTLHYVPDEQKRQRIAKETMEIYAPLAERIGLQAFKAELEDLAFKELNPDGFHTMETRLKALRDQAGGMVERVTESLTATLRKQRLRANGRGPGKAALLHLGKDAAQEARLRAAYRHCGLPRRHRERRGLLPGARYRASRISHGAGPLQGLHLDAQAQRVPLAPHRGDRARAAPHRDPDSHPRHARRGRVRRRGSLAVQAGGRRPRRPSAALASPVARNPRQGLRARGAARARQARDV